MTNQHVQQAHPVRSDYHLIGWLKTEDRDALFLPSLADSQWAVAPHCWFKWHFFLFVGIGWIKKVLKSASSQFRSRSFQSLVLGVSTWTDYFGFKVDLSWPSLDKMICHFQAHNRHVDGFLQGWGWWESWGLLWHNSIEQAIVPPSGLTCIGWLTQGSVGNSRGEVISSPIIGPSSCIEFYTSSSDTKLKTSSLELIWVQGMNKRLGRGRLGKGISLQGSCAACSLGSTATWVSTHMKTSIIIVK